jgi:hypothetical protein
MTIRRYFEIFIFNTNVEINIEPNLMFSFFFINLIVLTLKHEQK